MPPKQTLPAAAQLAGNVPPLTRLYIEAIVAEATAPLLAIIEQLKTENAELRKKVDKDIDEFRAMIGNVKARNAKDDRYSLSREKIIRFMKAQGIE